MYTHTLNIRYELRKYIGIAGNIIYILKRALQSRKSSGATRAHSKRYIYKIYINCVYIYIMYIFYTYIHAHGNINVFFEQ